VLFKTPAVMELRSGFSGISLIGYSNVEAAETSAKVDGRN
jgi:hypothetical protein